MSLYLVYTLLAFDSTFVFSQDLCVCSPSKVILLKVGSTYVCNKIFNQEIIKVASLAPRARPTSFPSACAKDMLSTFLLLTNRYNTVIKKEVWLYL
jgi:hypothetical protein